jgi:hypothetical protein
MTGLRPMGANIKNEVIGTWKLKQFQIESPEGKVND